MKLHRADRSLRAVVTALGFAMSMSGCQVAPITKGVEQELKVTRATAGDAQESLERAKRAAGAVVRHTAAKVGGDEIELTAEKPMPPIFSRSFTYVSSNEPLAAVADDISRKAGIPIRLVNVAQIDGAQGQVQGGAPSNAAGRAVEVSYKGPLSGLLDLIAQKSKSYWRYVDGGVEFFEVETRSFQIYLSPGRRTVASSISLTGAGSGSGTSSNPSSSSTAGGGTVSVDSSQTIDAYAGLVASVEALIEERIDRPADADRSGGNRSGGGNASGQAGGQQGGGQGGGSGLTTAVLGKSRVVANPALGMITVTATPPVMSRVASYIKTVNDRFASNVRIEVKIYSLTLNRGANVGFSADLVYRKLGQYGLGVTGQGLLQPSGGTPSKLVAGVTDATSRFNGSNILVQALSEFGDVGFVTSGEVMAPNGQPSPLQMADEVTYLSSISTVQTANVGSTTTLVPATRTVGFTANFLPLMLGDNRILLQYQINLSHLASLNQITSGGATIQTPNIRQQSLQQQAFVRDGQMIVLFGFESSRAELTNNQGLTGVSNNASQSRQMTIITMQVHGGRNV